MVNREPDMENRFGDELRAARVARGLTVYKLAKISDVSRRHIVTAERGGNISILVLKKLARVLALTQITITDTLKATINQASTIAPANLKSVLEDMERSIEYAATATTTLRAVIQPGVGKSIQGDTPMSDEINERAAALIGEFTEHVRRSLADPGRLAEIGEAVTGMLRSEPSSGEITRTSTGARRKRHTA